MNKSNKFSPEVRERAVRMVQEHRGAYPSLWDDGGNAQVSEGVKGEPDLGFGNACDL